MDSRITDVLVIGAGPAGAAAAVQMARAGASVILADRQAFPREKVCGDALLPDALRALEKLGLSEPVVRDGKPIGALRLYPPDGSWVSLEGRFTCLERSRLDDLLLGAARDAGARFVAPARLVRPVVQDDRVGGAVFERPGDRSETKICAELTILATGAGRGPLETFGVCDRLSPSAMAVRSYIEVPEDVASAMDHLAISFDRAVCPGYGWVFPIGGRTFNIGVGLFHDSHRVPVTTNLRELWQLFTASFEPARRIVDRALHVSGLKGAPLRTGLSGSRLYRPGLLVVGEAAGLTYSLSGEGIGKAMESGMLAAEIALERLRSDTSGHAGLGQDYAEAIRRRYGERYRGYRRAQRWLANPALCNLFGRRARAGRWLRAQLEAMIAETADPLAIFSLRGLLKTLVF